MKTWKNLFIKEEGSEQEEQKPEMPKSPGFPVAGAQHAPLAPSSDQNPFLSEIMKVYEDGLEKINMPGYDFIEFYNSIYAAGSHGESAFKMAFQMGKTMDKTITPDKLVSDASLYINKIGDVHQVYKRQGQERLDNLNHQLQTEKNKLAVENDTLENEIKKLKAQIADMETGLQNTKNKLSNIDKQYDPEKEKIKLKLSANDTAMEMSIQKISIVKDGILKFLKA